MWRASKRTAKMTPRESITLTTGTYYSLGTESNAPFTRTWGEPRTVINGLVVSSESWSKAFSEWGCRIQIKRSQTACLLSSLYRNSIGCGDCSMGRKEKSGNWHLINSLARRRRQQSVLTMIGANSMSRIHYQSLDQITGCVYFSRPSLLLLLTHSLCTLLPYKSWRFPTLSACWRLWSLHKKKSESAGILKQWVMTCGHLSVTIENKQKYSAYVVYWSLNY